MARRSRRLVLVLAGLLITAGLGYRARLDDQALDVLRQHATDDDHAGEGAALAVGDLRAALHAYVSAGQEIGPWAARTNALVDTLREQLIALDTAAARSGGSMADALDSLDQLTAADKRARAYVGNGQALLAGDVVFTEGRDLLDGLGTQVASIHDALRRDSIARSAGIRQEQLGLVGGALGLWVVVAFLLVPTQKSLDAGDPVTLVAPVEPVEPVAPVAPVEPVRPVEPAKSAAPSLAAVAEICSDLSTLSDVGALTGALARAADVLGATGVIVWVASTDGTHLSPVASHGFDPRMVARIGAIPRDSSNLTAAAFREAVPRVTAASPTLRGALAVAMCGPSGPVGVLSAELRQNAAADDACVAFATIFAAQLATLALPVPSVPVVDPAWPQQAQV